MSEQGTEAKEKGQVKGKIKKLAINICIFLVASLIMLFLAEIFLRLFYPQNLNITRLDPDKVFEHKPGIASILKRQEFETHVQISSQGLRDRDYPLEKPLNITRIAMIGDSFVFGFGVELNESITKLVERKLNAGGKHTEVMNFGVSAYGTEQEYITLKNDVLQFDPDIVVIGFFPNDIKENVKFNLFDYGNGTLAEGKKHPVTLPQKIRNMVSWHSHLYSLFYFSVMENQKLASVLIKMHIINKPFVDPSQDFNVLLYSKEETPEFSLAMEKTEALLAEMSQTLKKGKIGFVVLLIPTREQVDPWKFSGFAKKNNLKEGNLNTTKVQQSLTPFLKKEGAIVVDPLSEFRSQNQNNSFYFTIDGHWNERGNELAATILARELIKKV